KLEANRFLFYGRDVAEIQRAVRTLEKRRVPLTTIRVADSSNQPVAGAFVDIYNRQEEPVSFAITGDDGTTEIPLTPGDYRYYAFKVGHDSISADFAVAKKAAKVQVVMARSEEHTSELQSRENIVCRLLLEKKKIKNK